MRRIKLQEAVNKQYCNTTVFNKTPIKYVWVCGWIEKKTGEFIFECAYRREKGAKLWSYNNKYAGHFGCSVEKCHKGVYFMAEMTLRKIDPVKIMCICERCGSIVPKKKLCKY